jgi:putative FmdB family regulatory protein
MPTYEFRCPQGHEFEKFYRTISGAEAQAACSACGLPSERVMSATGFAFKGSGFYLTDYGKNAHRGTEPKPAGASGDGASNDSKSESKTDAGAAASAPSAGGGDAKPATPKVAEAKPVAPPPKKSSGE